MNITNIVGNQPVEFKDFKFNEDELRNLMYAYDFYNQRPITKSMLAWWAFNDESQELLNIDTPFDIEHIFAKNRVKYEPMNNKRNLELLGNHTASCALMLPSCVLSVASVPEDRAVELIEICHDSLRYTRNT